ncbi:MAG: glycosyl hydrolase family 18 [Satyrvirus sp.]|uniref:Glycosyl hydrolase family 18 n=1 Tax=Satyrvirus sp. TaxID=2487771 RepID=A0A3G5AE72_9VIRU|nr:MAG: glycosyl hydrolase family 18 [Satyrvirus sp.]
MASSNKVVMAYYTEWSIYQENFSVSQIPVNSLTHILYAFMLPNPNQADYNLWANNWAFPAKPYTPPPTVPEGTLVSQDGYANGINITNLKNLKTQNPNIKILISVGGWSMSWIFSKIFADPTLRSNFVNSTVQFVVSNGFDGVDLDWEYPGIQGIGFNYVSPNDPANLALTLQNLRAAFQTQSPNKKYLLTVAMGTNENVITNYKNVVPYVDYINMMTYDYAGSWGNGGHLTALYYNPKEVDIDPQWNVSSAIQNTLNIGCPTSKMVLGFPMYARGWSDVVPYDPSLPLFGKSVGGAAKTYSGGAGEPGLSDWKDMVNVINTNGLNEYYDSVAMASFVHNNTTGETWTYDNPKSVALKTQYAINNNLAGIMFWELSEDTRNGTQNLLSSAISVLNNSGVPPTNPTYNFNVNLILTQTSSSGGTGIITITNNGSAAQTNWSFQLSTTNFVIQNFSQLSMNGSGNSITVVPLPAQPTLNSNQTISSSFTYTGSGSFTASSSTTGITVTTRTTQNPPPSNNLNFTVTLQSNSNWGTGGTGTISVTNNSSNSVTNWSFQLFTNSFAIQDLYTLAMTGSGSNINISAVSWQPTINPQQTITSGFDYTGSSLFSASTNTQGVNITTVNNNSSIVNFSVHITSTSFWGTGGNGQITITNSDTSPVTEWSFQLSTPNFTIQSIWGVTMAGSGNSITIAPPAWQPTLNNGQQIVGGFTYVGTNSTLQVASSTHGVNFV